MPFSRFRVDLLLVVPVFEILSTKGILGSWMVAPASCFLLLPTSTFDHATEARKRRTWTLQATSAHKAIKFDRDLLLHYLAARLVGHHAGKLRLDQLPNRGFELVFVRKQSR